MSRWSRIKEFFVGPPPRVRHDEEERPDLDWPPLAAVPDQPDADEYDDPQGALAWDDDEEQPDDRVLAVHDQREVGDPVLDEDGEPIILLGMFGGSVRQGPLFMRRTSGKSGGALYLIYDEESGAHWPVDPADLGSGTTTRVSG